MHFDGIIDDGLDKSLALLSNFSAIFSKNPLSRNTMNAYLPLNLFNYVWTILRILSLFCLKQAYSFTRRFLEGPV